jgi:glycosyltransferase involved in cell wall biosynthesis
MKKMIKVYKKNNKTVYDKLTISLIIPCRNEEKFIDRCLNSVNEQDYPMDNLEVLVVDGMSKDKTLQIVENYRKKLLSIKILENPKKTTPYAFNLGINYSKADIIMIMSAHSTLEKDYISKCVKYLDKHNVDNVGGIWITLPGDNTIMAQSIALTLSHPFGVGNTYFRIGSEEPRYVDTVPFGCYRKEVFRKIGLFNEELIRNQDLEFNLRLKKAGGKILLVPDIVSYYYARSTLKALAKNNFSNGFWVIYSTKFAKMPFSVRHLIPFFFVISLIGSFILSLIYRPFIYMFVLVFITYLTSNMLFSLRISFKKGFKYFIPVILSFATLHFSYGFGSIWGLIKLMSTRLKKLV